MAGRELEARSHPQPVGAHPALRAAGDHRPGRPRSGHRHPRGGGGRPPWLPVGYRPEPAPPNAEPLPDVVSPSWKAPTSSGSTGRPKLIVSGEPALVDPEGRRRSASCPHPAGHACRAALVHNGHRVVVRRCSRAATWRCCPASTPRPRWPPSRPTSPRRLPRAHHDEAHLAAAPEVSATTCRRCRSSGIWPSPARCGSSKPGSTGSAGAHHRALWRHRSPGRPR